MVRSSSCFEQLLEFFHVAIPVWFGDSLPTVRSDWDRHPSPLGTPWVRQ